MKNIKQGIYPTPRSNAATGPCRHGDGGPDLQTAILWPTPTQQDSKNDGGASQYGRNSIPLNAATKPGGAKGQLNPDWVEWLMGWPVGWTETDPIQMRWLGWETDPADGEAMSFMWTTPCATTNRNSRNAIVLEGDAHQNHGKALSLEQGAEVAEGVLPKELEHADELPDKWKPVLGTRPFSGTIPRIGTGIENRVNRLKAIGNGQVPQCVAAAWRLLTEDPMTFIDARLLDMLFRPGGVKRSDLEGLKDWKAALERVNSRTPLGQKKKDGETWIFVKGRE